jgi:hypothetical protein
MDSKGREVDGDAGAGAGAGAGASDRITREPASGACDRTRVLHGHHAPAATRQHQSGLGQAAFARATTHVRPGPGSLGQARLRFRFGA